VTMNEAVGRWDNCPIRPPRKDLTGKRFGMLTVIKRSIDRGNGKMPAVKWECRCDCGRITTVYSAGLLDGRTTSCGCKRIKHGLCKGKEKGGRLYNTWASMRARCSNPNSAQWKNYGSRGIKVCAEWNDYSVFREWALSHGYADNLTIDRIDVNGDYCPENCRFVDAKAQSNNKRCNHCVEYKGNIYTLSQLADYIGLPYSTVLSRVNHGWSIERVVSQPKRITKLSR